MPKVITLSPGTTFVIPITFRPLEKVSYNDHLEIIQLDFQKSVKIPLVALLPDFKLEIVEDLNLGVCSIHDSVSANVKITNPRYLKLVNIFLRKY